MRSILAGALALMLLFGVAVAQIETYSPYESDTGKYVMPAENLGGPWYHTGHGITLGDDQNATITYSGTYDNVTVAGADMTVLNNLTSVGVGTFDGINITELSDNLSANDTRIGVLERDLPDNVTRIGALETDLGANDTRIGVLERDLPANVTRIGTLEADLRENDTRISALEGQSAHLNAIAGGSAGNHTLTGIAVGDVLNGVIYVSKGAENLTAVTDLGSEFTILDDDVIENAGHTDTTGGYLTISWDSLPG
jgi:hypothetical protein